jgi:DNA-binding GntR family transcriptional regulator
MSVVYRARWFMMARGPTSSQRFDDHVKIIDLIAANKPDEAVAIMVPHLAKARNAMLESIDFASRLLRGQGLKVAGK